MAIAKNPNLVLEPAEGALQRAQELYQGRLEEEPGVALPPVSDAGPTPTARAEPPVAAPVEQPAPLTPGDVAFRTLQRGLGIEVKGLSLTPATEEYDPLGFLADPIDWSKEGVEKGIQQASYIEAAQETGQMTLPDRKSYMLWYLHNLQENSRTNREYEKAVNDVLYTQHVDMLSHDKRNYKQRYERQNNPYWGNSTMLMEDLMSDPSMAPQMRGKFLPLQKRNEELVDAREELENAKTDREIAEAKAKVEAQEARGQWLPYSLEKDGKSIVAPTEQQALSGQFYYDKESKRFLYKGTFLDNLDSATTELSLAAERGLAEVPNFLMQMSGLVDLGLNYAAKGGMNGLQFIFDQVGLEVDLEVQEQFNKAMEATQQGLIEFTAEYEQAIKPWRDRIGQFGSRGASTTVEDRLVEELVVAGWIAIPFLQKAIKEGKRKATQFMAAALRQEAIIETTSVKGAESATAIIFRTREGLKRYVDDDVLKNLNTMPQEEALGIISQILGPTQARNYKASLEFLRSRAVTENKALRKAAQRYSAVPLAHTIGGGMSEITAAREIAAVGASELMMNLGFVVAEDMYPDDIVLQMGAGLFGGWWGMRGKNYAINQGPLGVGGKARSYFGPNGGNFQVNMYSVFKAGYNLTGVETLDHWAENRILKYLGVYDDFVRDFGEDATIGQKKKFSTSIAKDRGEFKNLVGQVEQAQKILEQIPEGDLRDILGKAEQIQLAIRELTLAGYSDAKLHETLSDTFAIPVLNMLELQLLNKIDVGLSLKMNRIPLISDYHSLLKMKQENLQSIKETLDAIGEVKNAGPASATLREHMIKIYQQEKQKFTISYAKLMNKVETEYKEFKDMITNPASRVMAKIRNDSAIDDALDLGRMDERANQLGHNKDANARFGEILENTLDEIDDAYKKVDHSYEFKGTDEMASVLEEIVLETVKTPDPTRTVVGVQPKAYQAKIILHSARYKYISRQLKKVQPKQDETILEAQLAYLDELTDTVLNRNPGADETSSVLSGGSRAQFEIDIADLEVAGDYVGIQKKINNRVGRLSQIDVADSGIGAVYTMGEFSILRSFVTTKSVSHSNGQIRYSFRNIRDKMDALINSADPEDVAAVTALKNANKLYREYSLLYKTGTGAKLTAKDAQGRSTYGNHYLDSEGMLTDSKDLDLQSTIPSEYNLFEHFLAPLFKPNVDKMDESFRTFEKIFLPDGKLASSDADLLLDNFALRIASIRQRKTRGVQRIEKAAYLNFMDRYGDLIQSADNLSGHTMRRFEQFKRLRKLYDNEFKDPSTEAMEKLEFDSFQRGQVRKLEEEQLEASSILRQFFDLRKEAFGERGSLIAQLANSDPDSAQDLARILFGKGEQGAESEVKRSPGMYPYITPETLQNLAENQNLLRGIDPEDVVGPTRPLDLKPNFVQAVEHLEDARATNFINEKEYISLKKALGTFLMDDMLKTVFQRINKQNLNVSPDDLSHGIFGMGKLNRATNLARELHAGGKGVSSAKEITSSFTAYNVSAAKMEDYLRNNRKAFEALFSKEHVDRINAAFKTSWAMGTEKIDETFTGLFQGFSASTLQSYFWAAARNVVSIRFVAGMLGFQAYRQGTTRFFKELLMNENNTAVLMKAMRQKTALTDAQEASFRKVFTAAFGPHSASFLTKDAMNKIREDWQKDQEEGLDQEDVQRRLQPTIDSASLDKLRAWQLGVPVEELPEDPYRRKSAAAILGTTADQIPAGVDPTTLLEQMRNLQEGIDLPPDKFARQRSEDREHEQMIQLGLRAG
jgi:flagellar hook-basal body complex protein FliE